MSTPAGTKDLDPLLTFTRGQLISKLVKYARLYGAQQISTPILEQMETVKGLYGENFDKEVFRIEHPTEELFLRYDLTLPLMRYVAKHGLTNFRRFQFGPVFRRDTPNFQAGRLREFVQFDFDIIGSDGGQMLHEAEILTFAKDILGEILPNYTIHLNHKQLLFNLLAKQGVTQDEFPRVCSTLDKIHKMPKEDFKQELAARTQSANVLQWVEHVQTLKSLDQVMHFISREQPDIAKDFENLFMMISKDKIHIDLLLARGLDYYTGLVFEITTQAISSTIVSGGRYDNSIERFTKNHTPAIGISFGVDRILSILAPKIQQNSHVFVASIGVGMSTERFKLCSELRKVGLVPKMLYTKTPKMGAQLDQVVGHDEEKKEIVKIKWMAIIGEDEIKAGLVKIKDIEKRVEMSLPRAEAIKFLRTNIR